MFAHTVGGGALAGAHMAADLHRGRAGARHGGRAADDVAPGALRADRAGAPGAAAVDRALDRAGGVRRTVASPSSARTRRPRNLAPIGSCRGVVDRAADGVPAAWRHRAPPTRSCRVVALLDRRRADDPGRGGRRGRRRRSCPWVLVPPRLPPAGPTSARGVFLVVYAAPPSPAGSGGAGLAAHR